MRKQIFLSSVLLLGAALTMSAAERGGRTVALAGVEYSVDTLFHAKVGPGTTETSLHLVNEAGQQLRVFYLTTDLTNPNTSIEAIVAQDKVPGGGTVSSMAKSHTVEGKNYFCGVNTDFFHTSGSASNGKSIVGAPVRASVAGGEIYRSGSRLKMERLQRAERLPLSRQSTTTLLTMVFQSIHRNIMALPTSRGLTVSV